MRAPLVTLACAAVLCVVQARSTPVAAPAPGGRRVAITIDDIPRGGDRGGSSLPAIRSMTERLLRPFREDKIPVIGFVNEAGNYDFDLAGLRQILDLWLDHGADLGNHSSAHLDINNVSLEQYTADILKGENVLRAALAARGRPLRFYRHPFLHTGATPEARKGLLTFLDAHGYRVAPVTLDSSDYLFAALYTRPQFRERARAEYVPHVEAVVSFFETRSVEVAGREFPQILLLHANELNADLMPDLLAMFKRRGYSFVSVEEALRDEAYSMPDEYVGPDGISWMHRWAHTRGIAPKYGPDTPAWMQAAMTTP
jgi:peptidoglycan-N-acetylglucosamine deacetylase